MVELSYSARGGSGYRGRSKNGFHSGVGKGWKTKSFPKSWKTDYGTVKYFQMKNPSDEYTPMYLQIMKIRANDTFRQNLYKQGYRFTIHSNKFGSSYYKTLPEAMMDAKKLMAT